MNDHALVAALRARAPEAPAALYDAYADRLYGYCWFRLCDDAAAQATVRETFIMAEAHIGRLRDADRFGPWLYALARLECDRRESADGVGAVPQVAGPDQDDVDQRIMAGRAVAAMSRLGREILELRVRHQLSVPDLGAVLDVPMPSAQRLLARANAELEEAITGELLAKEGPYDCSGRAEILRERRGELTAPMRRRLLLHARECEVCGTSAPRTVSAAKVYSLLPTVTVPDSLRTDVLSSLGDPESAVYREEVAARVTEFTTDAFPIQGRPEEPESSPDERSTDPFAACAPGGGGRRWTAGRTVLTVTAMSTGLVLGLAALVWFLHDDERAVGKSAIGADRGSLPGLGRTPLAVPDREGPETGTEPELETGLDAGTVGAVPPSPTWPLGARDSAAPPTAKPDPPVRVPPLPGAPEGPGGPERPRPAPNRPGTLVVSPRYLDLGGETFGSIALTAHNGPVAWNSRSPHRLRLHQESGRLEAGQSVTLWLRVSRRPGSDGQGSITFQPGGCRVIVTWRPRPPGGPRPVPTRPSPPVPDRPTKDVPSAPPSRPEPDSPTEPPSAPPSSPSGPPEEPPSDQPSSTAPEPPSSSGPSPAPEPTQTT